MNSYSSHLVLMAPPDWSDAGYQNHDQSGGAIPPGESGAEAEDRCMVVIEQMMFIEAC